MRIVGWALLLPLAAVLSSCSSWEEYRYGPHNRNWLEFKRAEVTEATPVLICFHGGAFVMGTKRKFRHAELTRKCLDSGISVVSVNYRFVSGRDKAPFPGPMLDGARAIQFVRSKAAEWRIDPDRIALTGGSAGGNMALWIALHDDLADPTSSDPIARESTKVTCVIGYEAQTSNDPFWVLKHIGGNPDIHPSILPFYGITSWGEFSNPGMTARIAEAHTLGHASKDDPPLLLIYKDLLSITPMPRNAGINETVHNPRFGQALKDRYDELGLDCRFHHAGAPPPENAKINFLLEQFGMK